MASIGRNLAEKCCNISYDILTILISIADVTTDVIVLIDFYDKGRMTFFGISLAILILAQCSYSIAFAVRFDTVDKWHACIAFIVFCCCLPFGSFVAFCIYLGSEEAGCDCFRNFIQYDLGLEEEGFFKSRATDSNLTKWIKKKLDRHLGFILEAAIEAFPQSLLQIIAIVYYQEANYISIISILLSMFSVMSKSLILSQGLETFTFVWTWLCVVTDFFGIFFTLTWVFYSHDSIQGDFLGYFNIFGQIWLWKFTISVLVPVCLGLIAFFCVGYWFMYFAMLCVPSVVSRNIEKRCGWGCLWIIFAPILAIICAFIACLAAEVFCFGIFAFGLYLLSTSRISNHRKSNVIKIITSILEFVSNGREDRILRILAINYGLYQLKEEDEFYYDYQHETETIKAFIQQKLDEGQYKALKKVTYKDIRANCNRPEQAHLIGNTFRKIISEYKSCKKQISRTSGIDKLFTKVLFVGYISSVFIFGPILLMAKLVQILYPWIIVGYLFHSNLIFTNQIDIFQLVMLAIYIGLQLILLLLGIYVFRIHFWIWHIEPGYTKVYWYNGDNSDKLMIFTNKFYDDVCWYPEVDNIVLNRFGNDIGAIIMDYCRNLQV